MAKNMLEAAKAELEKLDTAIPDGFTEVEFSNPLGKLGDIVMGVYLSKTQRPVGGKPINVYQVEKADGSIVSMFGAAQVDTFMDTVKPGDSVWLQRGPEIKAGAKGRVVTYRTAVKRAG